MTPRENVLAVYQRASDSDVLVGRLWYRNAREIAANLAKRYSLSLEQTSGIIAALSPQIGWKHNVALAAKMIKSGRFLAGHYKANLDKAKKIYKGANPLDVLGGHKVRAFYEKIVSGGEANSVCIDRHILGVCLGREATEQERKTLSNRVTWQRELIKVYRELAEELGLPVSELQAITWVTWRREKGIAD